MAIEKEYLYRKLQPAACLSFSAKLCAPFATNKADN